MRLSEDQCRAIWQSAAHDRAIGHQLFWERALSRRHFLGTAAAAGGVAAKAKPVGASSSKGRVTKVNFAQIAHETCGIFFGGQARPAKSNPKFTEECKCDV
jgi:hypothetical protein